MAKTILITGKLNKARKESKTFKGKKSDEKLYITLSNVELSADKKKELEEAFASAGKKFTPKWITDFEGYVNVSTIYPVPTKIAATDEVTDIETFCKENDYYNADCRMTLAVKDGAVYPKAIVIDSEGEPFDQFADFE